MDDIKQRRKRSRKDLQAKRLYFCLSRTEWKASAVKRHVTPPPWLMVQELLSLQLRFLDQRRGQAYSESKSPSDTLTLLASFLVPLLIGNVYATSGCTSGCQVTVSSNVASSDGTIWVQIDNGTGTYRSSNSCTVSLPQSSPPTFTFANNTIHTITVLSSNTTFTGSSTGGHYVWKEWANYFGTPNQVVWTTNPTLRIPVAGSTGGILYNYTGTAGFTAVFDKQ